MRAQDIMTAPPVNALPGDLISEAAIAMVRSGASLLPVVSDAGDSRLCGVITDRDILEECVAEGHEPGCHVRDHMTTNALETVHPRDAIELVVEKMENRAVHRVPVVDDTYRVVGLITRTDLLARGAPVGSPLRARILKQPPTASKR
jgi:CBS domain-containing protein